MEKSSKLALIVDDIPNPFVMELWNELECCAREYDYELCLVNAKNDMSPIESIFDRLRLRGRVEGLIIHATLRVEDLIEVAQRGMPLVLCNWSEYIPLPQLPTVNTDIRQAGYLVGKHLIELGHRRIAAIMSRNPAPYELTYPRRLQGLVQALREASLDLPEVYIRLGHTSAVSAYHAAWELLSFSSSRPSAIFVSNDIMATGVLNAATDAGIDVPRELSIVGVDDIALGAHIRPSLTTVALSNKRLAKMVVQSLICQVEKRECHELHKWIDPYLIKRQSTGPPQSYDTWQTRLFIN